MIVFVNCLDKVTLRSMPQNGGRKATLDAKRVRELRAEGKGPAQIAKQLKGVEGVGAGLPIKRLAFVRRWPVPRLRLSIGAHGSGKKRRPRRG